MELRSRADDAAHRHGAIDTGLYSPDGSQIVFESTAAARRSMDGRAGARPEAHLVGGDAIRRRYGRKGDFIALHQAERGSFGIGVMKTTAPANASSPRLSTTRPTWRPMGCS